MTCSYYIFGKKNYYYCKKVIIIIIIFLTYKNKSFLLKHIKMTNLIILELRLIAGKRGIKNYKNMSRERLLSTSDESEHNFKNISQNGLERIAKMQNLSQNKLEQITKMRNLLQNELEEIAKMRRNKNYKRKSNEGLLIALSKTK